MLAELVDHVIGVDPDRDWITAAIIDAHTTGVIATERFGADSAGYDEAISWAEALTVAGERAWAVEGTASYGRGFTAALARAGEWVIEFDRPRGKASKDGAKSDELDAVRAARETLGRNRLHEPRVHDGHREALRVHTVTRAGVVRARTAAINELKALVLTAPDDLRQELRHLTTRALVKRCAAFRDTPQRPVAERCARNTMRSIARRIICFNDEVAVHDTAMKQLIDEAAPQLVAEPGIGRHRRNVLHRLVTPRTLSQRSCLRPACRRCATANDIGPTPGPSPPQPQRRPATQQRSLRRRAHPKPQRPSHPRLPRPTTLRRQDRPRDPTLPQALHRTPSLAPPRAPTRAQNRCLTDIEESTRPGA